VTVNNEGVRRLELLAPLVYRPAPGLLPFSPEGGEEGPAASRPAPGREERLFCFALDETQGRRIDPDPAGLLGPLIAAGTMGETIAGETMDQTADRGPIHAANHAMEGPSVPGVPALELPLGRYLFAQERGILNREKLLTLAVELQKDGLWERLRLGEHLYLRYVYGDHGMVTQIFRPYWEEGTADSRS
jgi:hypothetical protein